MVYIVHFIEVGSNHSPTVTISYFILYNMDADKGLMVILSF